MIPRRLVNASPVHFEVVVDQYMAHARDLFPRDLWAVVLDGLRNSPGGFPDDLNVTQNMRLDQLVSIELGHLRRGRVDYLFDGFEHILEQKSVRPQSGIASLIT